MFTKLDLQNAFHLVCIREGDEYLVIPFGDAPAVFQGFLNNLLRDMRNHFVCMYIDEILIFSKLPKDYVQHVQVALLCLLQHSLFIKAEKCEIHVPSIGLFPGVHDLAGKHPGSPHRDLSSTHLARSRL